MVLQNTRGRVLEDADACIKQQQVVAREVKDIAEEEVAKASLADELENFTNLCGANCDGNGVCVANWGGCCSCCNDGSTNCNENFRRR